jgi:vitamin B12 transporter
MRFSLFLLPVLLVPSIVFGSPVSGADTLTEPSMYASLDEIVVTGTRTHVPVWRSPVPVSLISRSDLERRGGLTVADVLERSDPLTLRRYGSGLSLTTMSLRGVTAEQTVVLLNGIRLNSPQNGLVDLSTVPLAGVERIEIVRGGASSLYGNHAMGGVVNIITRQTGATRPLVDLRLGAGSYGMRTMNVQTGFRESAYDVSVGVGRNQGEGDFTFHNRFEPNEKLTRENADYVQTYATLDSRLRIDGKSDLGMFARYTQSDRGLPGAFYGNQSADRQEDEHVHAALSVSRILADDLIVELKPYLLYSEIFYESPAWSFSESSINRQYGAAFDITSQPFDYLTLQAGGELNTAGVESTSLTESIERDNTVAYISAVFELPRAGTVRSTLYPSVRYDRFSNRDADDKRLYEEVTWKVGVTLQPFRYDRFVIRGSAGSNFKAPGLNDMYWFPEGNPGLVPERSFNIDAGIRWETAPIDGLVLDAGLFSIRAKDRIIWMPAWTDEWGFDRWSPVNLHTVHSDGFEIDLRFNPSSAPLRIGLAYTYQDVRQIAENPATGRNHEQRMAYMPMHLVAAEIGFEEGPMRMTLFTRFTGERYTSESNDMKLDSFVLFDIKTDYAVTLGTLAAVVSFEVKNLLDAEYEVMEYYPMPGRHYEFNLRLRY